MASTATTNTAVAQLAWQLQKLGPPGKTAAGAFASPFSLYCALALALRGAGAQRAVHACSYLQVTETAAHCTTLNPVRNPTHFVPFPAGSSSEQELYHLLHQDKSRLLGLVAPKDATPEDVTALLGQISALATSLNDQAGNGCELVVASSIWTKNYPIKPEYASSAKALFQVRSPAALCMFSGISAVSRLPNADSSRRCCS